MVDLNTLLTVIWGIPLAMYLCVKVYDLWMWWNWDEWSLTLRFMGIRDEYTMLNFGMEIGVVLSAIVIWPALLLAYLLAKTWFAVDGFRTDRLTRLGRLKKSDSEK
jgi:hypothetical protein